MCTFSTEFALIFYEQSGKKRMSSLREHDSDVNYSGVESSTSFR